jgi:hypothetical protein
MMRAPVRQTDARVRPYRRLTKVPPYQDTKRGIFLSSLLDEVASAEGNDSNRSPSIINASKAVLNCAFLAEETITVKEELAELRAEQASLKAKQQRVRKGPPESGPGVQDG